MFFGLDCDLFSTIAGKPNKGNHTLSLRIVFGQLSAFRRIYIRSSSLSIILLWDYALEDGITLPKTPPPLCGALVPAVVRLRMLWLSPGAVLNIAPFITALLGVVR